MYCSIKDSKLEKKLVIFLFLFASFTLKMITKSKKKKQHRSRMLKICQVMHTRSTSQKKMLEARHQLNVGGAEMEKRSCKYTCQH